MKAGRSTPTLKARALQWLSQREHSRAELRGKLLRRLALEQRAAVVRAAAAAAGAAGAAAGGGSAELDAAVEATDVPDRADAAAQVDELLDWLAANRYLDDRRFVESRLNARTARYGNRRIESELKQHGVALDDASAAALRGSELARAREVWQRRFGGRPPVDAAERVRQARFLAGRGFSGEAIRRALRGDTDDV